MSLGLIACDLLCMCLVEGLAAPSFPRREAAHRALAAAGRLAWPALSRAEKHADPEVRARVRHLSGKLREERVCDIAAHLLPTGYPRLPWLQLNDHTENAWLEAARRRWGLTVGSAVGWPEYRRATQLRVESWLREGRTVAAIVAELNRMRDAEINWIVTNGRQHNPPITLPQGMSLPCDR